MLGGLSVFAALSPDPIQVGSMVATVVFSAGVAFATLKANQRHTDEQIEAVRQDLKEIKAEYEELSRENHSLRVDLAKAQARADAQERATTDVSLVLKDLGITLVLTREAVIEIKGLLSAGGARTTNRSRGGA